MELVPAEPGLGRGLSRGGGGGGGGGVGGGLSRARRARALCGVHETQPAAEFLVCF